MLTTQRSDFSFFIVVIIMQFRRELERERESPVASRAEAWREQHRLNRQACGQLYFILPALSAEQHGNRILNRNAGFENIFVQMESE